MSNIAILIGNTEYTSLNNLECCRDDVAAVNELLNATNKFDKISKIENHNASDLKDAIRLELNDVGAVSELLVYYTGHGYALDDEFFICATNFDERRPNQTGLSTTELHNLLRSVDSDLVVKIIDACNSGTHLMKNDIALSLQSSKGINHLIQIASCLENQSSLTGDPLSVFTENFIDATLTKAEGAIYYSDIISALRDQFISNNSQTPFFIFQSTCREKFVDDARKLDSVRETASQRTTETSSSLTQADEHPDDPPLSARELLEEAEAHLATPNRVASFVDELFDGLKSEIDISDFTELFDFDFVEHDDFWEPTPKKFIIEVLTREKRPDNFVTAEVSRQRRRTNPLFSSTNSLLSRGMAGVFSNLYDDEEYIKMHDLELNCKIPRAQIRITLTPKYSLLQRIVLVLTCAPSLEVCYIFEVTTRHKLRDFGEYDEDGIKVAQKWYKFEWDESTEPLTKQLAESLKSLVSNHVDAATDELEA